MYKILYVEDEPFLAKIVKESLESRAYEVTHVSHGNKAMHTYLEQNFDICVLDVMLPGKNGFEIAKAIRQENEHIPILFLTAKDQTNDLITGFDAGGNDYIKKPFSIEELIVRILNLIKLTKGSVKDIDNVVEIEIGKACVFHVSKMQLDFGDKTIKLSHKENQILFLLCENMNQILKRKKLLLDVWNDDSYFNSRNLDVYIRKIRKHFEADPRVNIITLKGIGYRFQVEK